MTRIGMMRVENVFSLIFVSIGNAVSPFVSQNLGAKKTERIKDVSNAIFVPKRSDNAAEKRRTCDKTSVGA